MRVALVHDDFIQNGGAEKLFVSIAQIWPEAPIFTSCFDKKVLKNLGLSDRRIEASFIQKLPLKKILYRAYFPLYPLAFESFNFDDFDVIVSSTTRFAKGIVTKPSVCHISYVNSPPRFLWETKEYFEQERVPNFLATALLPLLSLLRIWDQVSSERIDFWVANSKNVATRIKKRYQKEAKVIYPGIDLTRFEPSQKSEGFFLIVSRLVGWKRIEIAIEAFNRLNLPLVIIGDGSNRNKLKEKAKDNIKFLGRLPDCEVDKYFQKCKALLLTQEEDFGLTILEANACGKPVVSLKAGGACELIEEGKNGMFFFPQESKALIKVIGDFEKRKFSSAECVSKARLFSKENFQKNLKEYVEKTWKDFNSKI
jgi:glycosyltransferase involved in cell wall biosynthesis